MSTADFTVAEVEAVGNAIMLAARFDNNWPDFTDYRVTALPPLAQDSRPAFSSDQTWQRDWWIRVKFELRQRRYGLPSEPQNDAERVDALRAARLAVAETISRSVPVGHIYVEGVVDPEDELMVDGEGAVVGIRFAGSLMAV